MIEAKIFSLVFLADAGQFVVTLEESNGARLLPIWIGPSEGIAIQAAMEKQEFPRPLTHDLFINTLKMTGAKVEKVIITELKNEIFYASLIITHGPKEYAIDSRPSDSIALAVKLGVPIFVADEVFEKFPLIQKPITDKEAQDFKDRIKTLKPEDFFRDQKNE